MSTKLITSIFAMLFTSNLMSSNSALRIEIKPSKVTEETPGNATITCLEDAKDALTKSVYNIQIIRNEGQPLTFIQMSGVTYDSTISNSGKFQAEGLISKAAGESYLKLSISEPDETDAGIYYCKMFYSDVAGRLVEHRASANLTIDVVDISQVVRQLLNQMTQLEKKLEAQTNIVVELKEANRNLTDKEFKLQEIVRIQSQQIADLSNQVNYTAGFSAALKKDVDVSPGAVIIFDRVLVNYGNAYDGTTGIFTVPRAGLYAFDLALMTRSGGNHDARAHITANDVSMATIYAKDTDIWDQSSISCMRELNPGDQVKAVGYQDPSELYNWRQASLFTGYLVRAF